MNPFEDSVQQKLTRSLEYALYSKFLEFGLLPNRETFAGDLNGYKAKQSEIKARKGFCVEVFGHGSSADRDTKYIPRVVITGQGFYAGSLGNDGLAHYAKNEKGTYDKLQGPIKSANYRFEVELTSNKTSQDNVLEAIRAEAIPDLNYVEVYNVPGDSFLVQYGGIRNMPDYNYGLIRKIYTYDIIDVFERLSRTLGEITPIKEITVTDATDGSQIDKVPVK